MAHAPLKHPVHVLHIIEAFGGGTLTALSCLCRSAQPGVRHSVAHGLRPETPPDFASLFPPDVTFHRVHMRRAVHPLKDLAALREVTALIRAVKPDIVHCHSSKAGVVGRAAARLCGVPSVYTPHGYSFLRTDIGGAERRLYREVERLCGRIGDAIAACGDEEYALALETAGPGSEARLIRNAVDCGAAHAVVPYDWGLPLPVVGICGRFTPQRSPGLFFSLAERLRHESAWVWIGGGAPEEAVPACVRMTPWLPRQDVLARIAGMDVYVHTSAWDGLSCSILEAMALGKPVVACDIPANRGIVKHGVTGFLAATEDDLAACILTLARDGALREKMGAAARGRALRRHSPQSASRAHAALYADLAARKRGERHGRGCLFIMHSFGGGAQTIALTLARSLTERGLPVQPACVRHIPALEASVPPLPFLAPAGPSWLQRARALRRIRTAARASRIVLGTLELQSIFWAALFGKGKAVGWLHKDLAGYFAHKPAWYAKLYAVILGWAFSRCAAVVCVSRGVLDSTRSLFPAAAAKLRVLHNPIDFAAVEARAREALPPALAACFAKPVILGVGRLVPQKAFHVLVRAHAALRARGSDHNLCILGEGPLRGSLEREAEDLGVRDSTFLPGFMNPCPAMRRAAVLGVSSVFEGFPTVIMEALALGLPVASTDCPHGPDEILDGGRCGKLTPVNDPDALALALSALISGNEREAYIRAGLDRVRAFSPESATAAWEALLSELREGAA